VDNVLLFPLYVLVVVVAGFTSVLLARWLHARRRARQRVVERPNSHYTSHTVRRNETRNRWRAIDRDQLHEINRAEVDRLLARVDAAGADSMRADERRFLDYLVELTGGGAASPDGDAGDAERGTRRDSDGGPGTRTVADARSGEA
jgi:hypothetical protein